MKKFLLLLCIPLFFAGQINATDVYEDQQASETTQQVLTDDTYAADEAPNTKDFNKKIKKLKRKSIIDKLNPFKKAETEEGYGNFIVAFLLGFLLGLIGVLIAFLIYLKHENRKRIMSFAWLGWLWWLVLLTLILFV
jgi:hypothetical protein